MSDYKNYNDQQLVDLLRNGDQIAYTEIYDRYSRLLYLFAYKRLGNREEVKDLLHEVFLSLWLNHMKVNLSYSLSTYLYSAVRNKIIDILSRKQLSSRYAETFTAYKPSSYNTTDHLLRHNILSSFINKEIESLPKKMQQVFKLSRETDLTRKEIAEELGLSEQTVKSHMHHALKVLKVKLGRLLACLCLL